MKLYGVECVTDYGAYGRGTPSVDLYYLHLTPYGAERRAFTLQLVEDANNRNRALRGYSVAQTTYTARELTWRERERARFYQDVYKWPVWSDEDWWNGSDAHRDHFAHVSIDDPTMIAFTENDAKGEADRQTRMKPGKYLKRFFDDVLSAKQIAFYAEWFAKGERPDSGAELRFASKPHEIVDVYADDTHVSSCMANEDCVRVYGAGDLAIAYLVDVMNEREPVTARALVWPAKQLYGRLYGDEDTLAKRLRARGYKSLDENRNGFNGARLLKIEHDRDEYVMPYLDRGYDVDDGGDHFIMRRGGEYDCEVTCGYIKIDSTRRDCDECGSSYDYEDEGGTVYTGWNGRWATGRMQVCDSCCSDSFYCEATNEMYLVAESVDVEDYGPVVLAWAERHAFQSDHSGLWFHNDERVVRPNGESWANCEIEEVRPDDPLYIAPAPAHALQQPLFQDAA